MYFYACVATQCIVRQKTDSISNNYFTKTVRCYTIYTVRRKLQRIQKQMQGTIFKLWEEYDKNKSASQLLRSCAALHGPIHE